MNGEPAAPPPTLVVTPEDLAGERLVIRGAAYRHLFRARRLAVGERLRLVDGGGRARLGRVAAIDRRRAEIELGGALSSGEALRRVELLVAVPRAPRAAWLVEKATELGVAAVRFVAFERSARRLGGAGLDRLRRVARAAVEQSHRSVLPELTGVHAAEELEALLAPAGRRLRLEPGAPPADLAAAPAESLALAVGPEGGWTEAERLRLAAAGCGAAGLGATTLRIETAALAAAALALCGTSR